jgi:hypothetical protein
VSEIDRDYGIVIISYYKNADSMMNTSQCIKQNRQRRSKNKQNKGVAVA